MHKTKKLLLSLQAISGGSKMFAARFTTVSLEVKNRLGYGRWLPVKTDCEIKNPTRDPLIGQHDLGDKVRTTDLMDAVITNSSPSEVSPSWFKAQDLDSCIHWSESSHLNENVTVGANPPSRKKLR